MKKYCLTKCAKDKLWALKNKIYEFLTAIFFVILIFLAILIFGLIVQAVGTGILGHLPFYELNPLVTGLMSIAIITFLIIFLGTGYMILLGIYRIGKNTYQAINGTIKTFTGHPSTEYTDCRIFEECTK